MLERKKNQSLGVLEKPDGTDTDPGIDTLEFLMKSHFPSITPPLPIRCILDNMDSKMTEELKQPCQTW